MLFMIFMSGIISLSMSLEIGDIVQFTRDPVRDASGTSILFKVTNEREGTGVQGDDQVTHGDKAVVREIEEDHIRVALLNTSGTPIQVISCREADGFQSDPMDDFHIKRADLVNEFRVRPLRFIQETEPKLLRVRSIDRQ